MIAITGPPRGNLYTDRMRSVAAMVFRSEGPEKQVSAMLRVRLKIIGNFETMHDSYLPTFLITSLPIIFKRAVAVHSLRTLGQVSI